MSDGEKLRQNAEGGRRSGRHPKAEGSPTLRQKAESGRTTARRKLQEWKLDLDPGRRDQHDLVFDHARHRIPGAFVLTQRFTHGSPSRPHKRVGVETETPIAFSTGVRLSVFGGCLSHIPCGAGPTDRPLPRLGDRQRAHAATDSVSVRTEAFFSAARNEPPTIHAAVGCLGPVGVDWTR